VAHEGSAYIDGQWVNGSGGRLVLVDPATETAFAEALDGSAGDVAHAVDSAGRALREGSWRRRGIDHRLEVLARVIEGIGAARAALAALHTRQMGSPITASRALVDGTARMFAAYRAGAAKIDARYLRRDAVGQSIIRRDPVGVVAVIIPWNGPLASVVSKVVPALIAGCSVVVKPAPSTPLEAYRFAELCTEAGVPDGVVNVVSGGAETGEQLICADGVDQVNFTGSTVAGRRVGELCGGRFRRVSLELGGKSAAVLLDDADLDVAVPALTMANFFNAGQICVSLSRVLVPRARMREVTDRLAEAADALVVGDPTDEATMMGPLASEAQLRRVESYVERGRGAGATVLTGGSRPTDRPSGWYYRPTIFVDVDNEMVIAQEEIFGPVMCVIGYEDEAEAVTIANHSRYGLHGAVFGADPERALSVARALETGSVTINGAGLTPGTPYGGVKSSGLGRDHGREGIESFLELHSYVVPAELVDSRQADGWALR
jgi:aldehyde dehydrogenase (NAD+)